MTVYAIEGNVVDRVSNKNGKGWCEDVSPTLNTQDRHAVVYIDKKTDDTSMTWYAVENHANDSRCGFASGNIIPTLSTRMGTGGNNVPFVLGVREN